MASVYQSHQAFSGQQVPGNIQKTHSQDVPVLWLHLTWSGSGRVQASRVPAFSSTGKAVQGKGVGYRAIGRLEEQTSRE